jgi:hypoxanthine phosphoribosyltransferase
MLNKSEIGVKKQDLLWAKKKLIPLTWSEVAMAVDHIARKIRLDNFSPDIIIGISRGGLAPALLISHKLGVRNLEIVNAKYYGNGTYPKTINPRPMIGPIPFEGEYNSGLLVDDIAGTGNTISEVSLRLKKRLKNMKTATLVKNVNCQINLDYFFFLVDDFVVFPWEVIQPINESSRIPSAENTLLSQMS